MKLPFVWVTLLVFSAIQIALPAKIQNIQDLQKLAEEGDSNAQCLLGLQEMIGGDLYDPRIIDTVTVEQILLNKVEKWQDQVRLLPSFEKGSEFETGSKTKEAFKWVEKSAHQGNRIALYCLGMFYGFGMGVTKDFDQAIKYYEKAATLGFAKACKPLAALLYRKNDYKQAADWLWRGFDEGDLECKVDIARMFLGGKLGVNKDERKGFRLVKEAYEMNAKGAVGLLGTCYAEGLGTSKDLPKAYALFKEGSKIDRESKFHLGIMYLKGVGTEKDEQKGLALIEELATTGDNPRAKAYLGKVYANGWGVRVDNAKAVGLFEQAAMEGNTDGMLELGKAYYFGTMVKGDKELAKKWLQKAKERGVKEADELLSKIEDQKAN